MQIFIIRYGELWLKGLNRRFFENKLIQNIKNGLLSESIHLIKLNRASGYLVLRTDKDSAECLKHVFGIATFSSVVECELDMSEICRTAVQIAAKHSFESFCVRAKRMSKKFEHNSLDIERIVGERILRETNKKVDLKKPELTVFVEIGEKAYLSTEKMRGAGGLPVGTSADVLCVIAEKEDLVAAWMLMKRGCRPILFVTGDIDCSGLEPYSGGRLVIRKSSDLSEIRSLIDESKPVAAVGSALKKDFKLVPVFKPLVGLSSRDIDQIGKKAGLY